MDMSCIKRKLDTGAYTDPWEFVNDVFLMFENAWVYNRKTSRVYRYCSKVRKFLPVYSWPFLDCTMVRPNRKTVLDYIIYSSIYSNIR